MLSHSAMKLGGAPLVSDEDLSVRSVRLLVPSYFRAACDHST